MGKENTEFENEGGTFTPNLNNANNTMPSQLHEEPIFQREIYSTDLLNSNNVTVELEEESVMQIPIIKSVSCAGTTQTNTRLCGLVEASDLADNFRFNCFYCSEVFPMEKWRKFLTHLKREHFEREAAFRVSEYISEDHDYTPIQNPPQTQVEGPLEKVVNDDLLLPNLPDPLRTGKNAFETVILNPTFYYVRDANETFSDNVDVLSNSNKSDNNLEQRVLSPHPSNPNVVLRDLKDVEECKSDLKIANQNPTEISFEYTPRVVVDLLLDSMKSYPVLWQFDNEPFNEDFYEAAEDLCKIINDKFAFNIDNLKMRRSIIRILRFYCYFFPTGSDENNDKFVCYYEKCAAFLPPSVQEIAYARCPHCYICFRDVFDLKLHLFEEQKYLQWPLKCAQCRDCFRVWDEYEIHKHLPHYDEIFSCKPCNKTFFRRNIYNKHNLEHHPKVSQEGGKFECNVCGKTFNSNSNLRGHKIIHGERKYRCHLCPKTFLINARLMIHLRGHRKEYTCVCEVCGKAFIYRGNLRQHMKKHSGEKVNCSLCNLKLRKSSLNRHMRLLHPNGNETESVLRNRLLMRRAAPRKKRNYYCTICKISFENLKLTVEHNKELHSHIRKWHCKMCSGMFSEKINLKRHYRRKHNLYMNQARKLIDENDNSEAVLPIENDNVDKLDETTVDSRKEEDTTAKSKIKSPIKSQLLPDETIFEVEKVHYSTIQDEIMKVADTIQTEEIKMENINYFFTDLLEENFKNI